MSPGVRIACCLLVVAGAPAIRAGEPLATFEDREYFVRWPDGKPEGALIFLHGLSRHPFVEERDGMEAIAREANARGVVAIFPRARLLCGAGKVRCWSTQDADDELRFIDALVDHLESDAHLPLERREIVGFSNGGFMLGAALMRGLVTDYARVGVLSGGSPGADAAPGALADAPPVFLEAGARDVQLADTAGLFADLRRGAKQLRFRKVSGGHEITAARCEAFLRWFWGDEDVPGEAGSAKTPHGAASTP